MIQTLVKNKKYMGRYVALKGFEDPRVVSFGPTPQEAYKKAVHKGFRNPVITFIPSKEMVQIYLCH